MHGAKQNMKLVPISCQTKLSISDVIKILLIILGEGSLKKKTQQVITTIWKKDKYNHFNLKSCVS